MNNSAAVVGCLAVALSLNATAGLIMWSGPQDIALGFGGASGNETPAFFNIYLDVDGNATDDFWVGYDPDFWWVRLTDQGSWYSQLVDAGGGLMNLYPLPLDYGAEIDPPPPSGSGWFEGSLFTAVNFLYPHGDWVGLDNGYLGIRFESAGNTHYGWVRLSVAGDTHPGATIHDWAWNTTPGEGLWAGQTPEPSTWILFALGGLTIAFAVRRHIHKRE